MDGTLAIVLAGGRGTRLGPLTAETAKPVLPFAGTYRLIDFVFSNCVNSGIPALLFVTQYRADVAERYIERLRDLLPELGRRQLLVRAAQERVPGAGGTAEAVSSVLPLVRQIDPRFVLVLASDHVYSMDYEPMLAFHRESGAEVTVGAVEVALEEASQYGVLEPDRAGRILSFVEKPSHPTGGPARPGRACVSMGIYVFERHTLERALARDDADPSSSHDFGRDIIPAMVGSRGAWAYPFAGYWRDVGTLDSYFLGHRELLRPPLRLMLHDPLWPLVSAAWPLLPREAELNRHGSLLCPGCLCEPGSRVHASTVSPAARVGRGAMLEDCVILDGAQIGAEARLRRVIVDQGVTVPRGLSVGFESEDDRSRFVFSTGGAAPFSEARGAAFRATRGRVRLGGLSQGALAVVEDVDPADRGDRPQPGLHLL